MDMKEEMMSDTMDDVFEEDNEEEEVSISIRFCSFLQTDEIINQVLDEIGINLTAELVDTPSSTQSVKTKIAAPTATAEGEDMDLQARLDNLRKT